MAWKFEPHHLYRVVKEWHQDINPSMRVDRIMVHDLHVGEVLRFRSPNLGMANFLDAVGRLLVISGRDAFEVFEPANIGVQPTAPVAKRKSRKSSSETSSRRRGG